MPEHYTRNTVAVSVWCNACGKPTMHRVDDRRRGPCLECLAKREREAAERAPVTEDAKAEQGELF